MRGLGGFVLLAGIGVGLFVYFPAPVDRDTSLEQAQRAVATRVASNTPRSSRQPRRQARAHHRAWQALRPASGLPLHNANRVSPPHRWLPPRPPSPSPQRSSRCRRRGRRMCRRPLTVGGPQGSLDPTDPESRYKLVVDIQQQLKRVGCYWGRVNGSWNNNTRESMRSFTTHTNAALPVEKPDYLLLSLLKSHTGRSCGAPETTVAVQPRGKNEHVAAATPEVLPWKAGNAAQPATRLYTPLPNSVVSTEPLPGRMAIGAPRSFRRPCRRRSSPTPRPGPLRQASRVSPPPPSIRAPLLRPPFQRRPLGRSSSVKPRSLGHGVVPGRERHATI